MGAHLLIAALLDILCQSYGADKCAGISEVAFCIDPAHRHELVEPCAVVLAVDTGDSQTIDIGASVQQCLPPYAGAVVKNEGTHVTVGFKRQTAVSES